MPLGTWFTGQWYGEAAAAAVVSASSSVVADVKGNIRGGASLAGSADIPLAKPTRLVNSPATLVGTATITTALPKANLRASATIKVNTLSQDDVTGAVLEAEVAPGLTLKRAIIETRRAARQVATEIA